MRDTWAAKVAMAEKAAAGREEELEQRIAELQVELADGDGGFGYDNVRSFVPAAASFSLPGVLLLSL